MNIIADRLFSLLLGWTRGLFNNLWNLVTNNSSGITGFLERFWLPLILLFLLVGTATDYIVWLIRWRPYYVWRSWFLRRDRHKRMQATQAYMADLDEAPLDLGYYPGDASRFSPVDEANEAVHFPPGDGFPYPPEEDYQPQPVWHQAQSLVAEPPPAPAYPEPELPFAAWTAEPQPQWQEQADPQENAYQAMWEEPLPEAESAMPAAENVSGKPTSRRRRRSETKRQRQPGLLHTLRETLINPLDPSEQLDSLPPPISPEDAFHQPYYPENYKYRPAPHEGEGNGQ